MPTVYKRCGVDVENLAGELLHKYEDHKPVLEAKVSIDYLFAYNESGRAAIRQNGYPCLGLTRKIGLKDRVKGAADAEIILDGDWWEKANDRERRGLLDHELHHVSPKMKNGAFDTDDQGRPKIELRKHDWQFGWFGIIAERHGKWSQECVQAKSIMDKDGQLFWPSIAPTKDSIVQLPTNRRLKGGAAKALKDVSTPAIEDSPRTLMLNP